MKNAIIIHGKPGEKEYYDPSKPSASNYHWIPWLQKQLVIKGIQAQTPEMPLAFRPEWEPWSKEFERFDITSETILVGHSCGGGFIVRYLSEHPELLVGTVVLVAPWLDPTGRLDTDFFNFELKSNLSAQTKQLVIFNSDNDSEDIQKSVELIRANDTGVIYKEFHNMGHFIVESMESEEFPELVATLT